MTPWTIACQAPLPMRILQARILEWVAVPSSRESSQSRDRMQVSHIAGRSFTIWATILPNGLSQFTLSAIVFVKKNKFYWLFLTITLSSSLFSWFPLFLSLVLLHLASCLFLVLFFSQHPLDTKILSSVFNPWIISELSNNNLLKMNFWAGNPQ